MIWQRSVVAKEKVRTIGVNDYVTIIPAGQKDSIKTILGVGWNPEVCKGVINAPSGVLQYGY